MQIAPELKPLLARLDQASPGGYCADLHIRFASATVAMRNYPQDWQDNYARKCYALCDPLTAWGLRRTGACRWSEMGERDPLGVLADKVRFGLRYGLVVSTGPEFSRTIVGASRPDREFSDTELCVIEGIVQAIHQATDTPSELTEAQAQALRCIARGDRHKVAAARLGISESALKARLTSARDRLLARTMAEAVQRATDHHLL